MLTFKGPENAALADQRTADQALLSTAYEAMLENLRALGYIDRAQSTRNQSGVVRLVYGRPLSLGPSSEWPATEGSRLRQEPKDRILRIKLIGQIVA